MKTMVKTGTIFVLFLLSASFCLAQDYQSVTAVKFSDGSIVRGKIIEVTPTTIKILKPDGNVETRRYQDVVSFIKGPYAGEQPPAPPSGPPPVIVSPPPPPPQPFVPPPPRPREAYYRAPVSYVALKGGFYSPESDELRDFDTGFVGEVAFGHYFHRNFALELGVGYFEAESNHYNHYYGGYYYGNSHDNRIWAVPITLSLKPTLPFYPFELYGLVGGGLYIIGVETNVYPGQTGYYSFSDSAGVFGAHLGAGFSWNITPRVGIGVEGKYIWAEKTFEKTINNTTIQVNADVQGVQTTLNLIFRF